MRLNQFFIFCVFVLVAHVCTAAQSVLVSESVASVQGETLTSRDMNLSATLENIMNKKAHSLPQSKEDKIQAVNTLLLDKMVEFESQNLGFKEFSKDEFEIEMGQAEKAVAEPGIKIYQYKKDEIKKMLERKLIVKKFLKSKSESFVSLLTDQDLQLYFDKNRIRFGTVAFADIKENIRAYLMQQQREERLKSWVEVLKKKYRTRNYLIENQKHSENVTGHD